MASSYQDLLHKVLEIEKDVDILEVVHIDISSIFSTQTLAVPGYYELLNHIGTPITGSKQIKQSKYDSAYIEPQSVSLSNHDNSSQKNDDARGIAPKAAPNPLKAQAKDEINNLAFAFKKLGHTQKKEPKIKAMKTARDPPNLHGPPS